MNRNPSWVHFLATILGGLLPFGSMPHMITITSGSRAPGRRPKLFSNLYIICNPPSDRVRRNAYTTRSVSSDILFEEIYEFEFENREG